MREAFFSRRDTRINVLIGTGHFLSHFYALCLPPVFIAWQRAFGVSYAELGLSVALMAASTALAQTPIGILVDRYGARPFLVGGTLVLHRSRRSWTGRGRPSEPADNRATYSPNA